MHSIQIARGGGGVRQNFCNDANKLHTTQFNNPWAIGIRMAQHMAFHHRTNALTQSPACIYLRPLPLYPSHTQILMWLGKWKNQIESSKGRTACARGASGVYCNNAPTTSISIIEPVRNVIKSNVMKRAIFYPLHAAQGFHFCVDLHCDTR
jgi:hypothetical protein